MNCIIIGIAGGTGSGKSTFTIRLKEEFKENVAVIYHDNYYRRQDEIGTPFCVTLDFETEQDGCVTIRDRDSMEQERLPMDKLADYIQSRIQL